MQWCNKRALLVYHICRVSTSVPDTGFYIPYPRSKQRAKTKNVTMDTRLEMLEKKVDALTEAVNQLTISIADIVRQPDERNSTQTSTNNVNVIESNEDANVVLSKKSKKKKSSEIIENQCGFCIGDEVKIISDKESFWSKRGRRKATRLENQCGIVTQVTKCFVRITVPGYSQVITKANDNVRLVKSAKDKMLVIVPDV